MNRLSLTFGWILVLAACVDCAHGQPRPGNLLVALRIADSLHTITDSARFTKEEIVSATGIEIVLENSDLDLGLKVVEFMLSTAVGDSLMAEAVSFNGNFTEEQRMIIGKAPSGGRIFIERIRVMDPSGSVHAVGVEEILLR